MMLDNLVNGDNSVENQLKQIALQKHKKNLIKKKKLSEKKRIWKESIQELNKLN